LPEIPASYEFNNSGKHHLFKKKFTALQQRDNRDADGSSGFKKNISDSGTMFIQSGHLVGRSGMKRFYICLAFLLLLVQPGIAAAADTTTTPERSGGSIYFETYPPGATIWLDNVEIGTSAFTYYFEKPGTFEVRVWKKGYESYTDTVTVEEGKRIVFTADLTPVTYDLTGETTPVTPVPTATTVRKSTLDIPTPWPTTTESPVDPALVIGAVALALGYSVIRRR
jgi:hypothetical protein